MGHVCGGMAGQQGSSVPNEDPNKRMERQLREALTHLNQTSGHLRRGISDIEKKQTTTRQRALEYSREGSQDKARVELAEYAMYTQAKEELTNKLTLTEQVKAEAEARLQQFKLTTVTQDLALFLDNTIIHVKNMSDRLDIIENLRFEASQTQALLATARPSDLDAELDALWTELEAEAKSTNPPVSPQQAQQAQQTQYIKDTLAADLQVC
ncbi:hypothetical protein GMRT_15371 [Giardia muris]|uniref:Uncharacterized protein n=1 Tax=Giardia muris TaxID=5742 RepID=A0A4Z1SYF2_GIAMU|nr:hypothetical protein GMRT_15371 [Giardia muris]|eukprot:TNJ30724.1 hypothetical protein GMRT_15371 [Giardia muris]